MIHLDINILLYLNECCLGAEQTSYGNYIVIGVRRDYISAVLICAQSGTRRSVTSLRYECQYGRETDTRNANRLYTGIPGNDVTSVSFSNVLESSIQTMGIWVYTLPEFIVGKLKIINRHNTQCHCVF